MIGHHYLFWESTEPKQLYLMRCNSWDSCDSNSMGNWNVYDWGNSFPSAGQIFTDSPLILDATSIPFKVNF
jgi:hypothetical protein